MLEHWHGAAVADELLHGFFRGLRMRHQVHAMADCPQPANTTFASRLLC